MVEGGFEIDFRGSCAGRIRSFNRHEKSSVYDASLPFSWHRTTSIINCTS